MPGIYTLKRCDTPLNEGLRRKAAPLEPGFHTEESRRQFQYAYGINDGVNPVQETSGTTVVANVLAGLGIDEFFTRTDVPAGTTSALLTDALGSALALADTAGTVQTEYTYEPFGKTTATGASSSNPFQYTGRENDATGLYYYRARYYHPTLQRFVSEDPLDLSEVRLSLQIDPDDEESRDLYWALRYNPELLHPSQFVVNNPLNYTDPTGEIVGAVVGGCVIGAGFSIGADVLGGRKIDWADAGIACVAGGLLGGAGRLLGPGGDVGTPKILQRYTRPYIRFDRPHHGKGYELDGKIPRAIRRLFK